MSSTSIKIESIHLKNFAGFNRVEVNLNPNVTYLIGKNGAGKSTIGLNSVWWILQGIAEKSSKGNTPLTGERFRFIGEYGRSAEGIMKLYDEVSKRHITITRKMTKDTNAVSVIADDGTALDQDFLNELFNLYLINPKKFTELSPRQQANTIGIDTSEYDTRIKDTKEDITQIGRDIKAFGELEVVDKTEKVNISQLNQEKNAVLEFNQEQLRKQKVIDDHRNEVSQWNRLFIDKGTELKQLEDRITAVKAEMAGLADNIKSKEEAIKLLPVPQTPKPTTDIDEKINTAQQTNEKAFQFEQYIEKSKKLQAKTQELQETKDKLEKHVQDKTDYLQEQRLPFKELTINDEGELLFRDRPIKPEHFSTGELIMLIPRLMAVKNPDFKYVFIQDFNLLDTVKQKECIDYLTAKGFQLVIEYVSESRVADNTCIMLQDFGVITADNTEEQQQEPLI